MEEKQIIKQLKQFRKVRPGKEWVLATKKEFFPEEKPSLLIFADKPVFLFGLAGAMAALTVAVLIITGVIGLPSLSPQQAVMEAADYEMLADSLKQLEGTLSRINSDLKHLKVERKGIEKILEVKKTVELTISQGENFLSEVKQKTKALKPAQQPPKEEVLSVLTDVENAFSEMKMTNESIQREVAGREIEELKSSILTEEQQKLLEEAERYFQAGSYPQALEKIIEISQSR